MTLLTLLFLNLLIATALARDCPRGSFFENRSCVPCPAGSYFTFLGCQNCPPGTFNPAPGATSKSQCRPCPAGTFADVTFNFTTLAGAAFCTACPPGKFSVKGAIECLDCPPGTFAPFKRAKSCKPCPRGRFSRRGYKRCIKSCPPGTALSPAKPTCRKCSRGTFRPLSKPPTKCLLCPAGTTSKKGAVRCRKCPKGTFRKIPLDFSGIRKVNGACRKCEINTFADVKGLETCKLCPLGTVSKPGAKKCTSCPAGTFRSRIDEFADSKCTPCPSGTTSLGMIPAGCKHPKRGCPVNTFEDSRGECRACMPGERLLVRQKKCVPCRKNQISLGGVAEACKTCPPGQRPADANTIFENSICECLRGTESDAVGGCKLCTPGTRWIRLEESTRALSFEPGVCGMCPVGSFSDKPRVTKCKPCPFETYSSFATPPTTCWPCPTGTTNTPGDADAADDSFRRVTCFSKQDGCRLGDAFDPILQGCELRTCVRGTLPSVDGFLCGSCELDHFRDDITCILCPDGQASLGGLVTKCKVCPKGARPDGICRCLGRFGDDGKGGCKRCPKGEISLTGTCGRCAEGLIPRFKFPSCERCPENKFKPPGVRRCKKCPKGFVSEKDVFGSLVNRCVPADLFPVV